MAAITICSDFGAQKNKVSHCCITNQYMKLSGFPGGSVGKESACNAGDAGDVGLIPGMGRFP